MNTLHNLPYLTQCTLRNPQILKVNPRAVLFLLKYFGKFKVRNVHGSYILHSHLPPITSPAYKKFVQKHLIETVHGPSHAQIGITNECPQNCSYCYNKLRSGIVMDTEQILKTIKELSNLGLSWLGLTGGEPLINKDIIKIIDKTDKNIAIKLFTTGCTLTKQMASDLRSAGLAYVSVSLDSHLEAEHDRSRKYPGAFKDALKAIELFLDAGLHTGVSAVLSRDMINRGQLDSFMAFLEQNGVHEAWLSEIKPSSELYWDEQYIITPAELNFLLQYQDEYNKLGKLTCNYLGHFEHATNFGCNAGTKMVYIDAFGEVSPCVFTPMTFGNVRTKSIAEIYQEMSQHFHAERHCFINQNYPLFKQHFHGETPIPPTDAINIAQASLHGGLPDFNQLLGA